MNNKLTLEFVWWVVTAVILSIVMMPIWIDFFQFKFHWTNVVFVLCFVTFTRYGFLLKHTFLASWEYGKIGFVLCTLMIVGILSVQIQDFNVWYDNGDPNVLLASVKESKREGLLEYIRTEFLFFAVASIISAFFLAGRLLFSIWRFRNRGRA